MNDKLFVSTLVAPYGVKLSTQQIKAVTHSIEQSGGKIKNAVTMGDGCAADIFYDMDFLWVLPPDDDRNEANWRFDILTQPAATRRKKLLVADMESTIIGQEMLDELASLVGVGEKTAEITRRAMNGELDFTAALTERVGLLKGQPANLLEQVASRMTLNPGAQQLVDAMKSGGGKAWLVSGGFTFFVKKIAEQAGFDEFFANDLKVEDGKITGQVALPVLDKSTKKSLLEKACATYGYTLADSVTVGDGANDVPMLLASNANGGFGVAYHAKPKVREIIPHQINHSDLSALVYAMGMID